MSDYFGALMRSSGLSVRAGTARAAAAADPGRAQHVRESSIGEDTDIAEIDTVQEMEPAGRGIATRRQVPAEPMAETQRLPLEHERRHVERPVPQLEADDLRLNESQNLERLQRAVIDAALRWVTSDPLAAPANAGSASNAPSDARSNLPDTREAPMVETGAVRAERSVFSRGDDDRVAFAELEIDSPGDGPSGDRPGEHAIDRPSGAPAVEDIVEVSIGSIHVRVDGGPARSPAPKTQPRRGGEGRERSSGSGLDRRYLRAI